MSELAARTPLEAVAFSRNRRHEPKRFKVFRAALERPIESARIDQYLKDYFGGSKISPDIESGISAHWSVTDRLAQAPTYDDDAPRLARLDQSAGSLPLMPRSDSLSPI